MTKNSVNKEQVVSIIPARGGSKTIPDKNIIDFCGKPLIAWTIESALNSHCINKVFVSTDDEKIADISKNYGAEIIWRPKELADDFSSSEDALLHAINEIEKEEKVDNVVFLQATSPLREQDDIDKAIEKFYSSKADSLFSSSKLDDFCIYKIENSKFKSVTFDYENRGRRQDREPLYLENGSIYIFKCEIIKKYNNRLGGKIVFYSMPLWKSYEVDSYDDLELCEFYMEKIIKRKNIIEGRIIR